MGKHSKPPAAQTERADNAAASIAQRPEAEAKLPRRRKHILGKLLAVLLVTCLIGAVCVVGTGYIVMRGPSEQFKILFVRTLSDTGSLRKIPYYFLSKEEIDTITLKNADEELDTQYPYEEAPKLLEMAAPDENVNPVELIDISGSTWRGKMILVHDPSLVILASPDNYSDPDYKKLPVATWVEQYGAFAGITAGGYRSGGSEIPVNFVINHGEVISDRSDGKVCNVVGFTPDHVLKVDRMNVEEAAQAGYECAVCWSPILIRNGEKNTKLAGGINPRAAIGQTADGTVLLAVIEGRQINSLGATYGELADLMAEYGAINACNLDSGRSSIMIYDGEPVTRTAVGTGGTTERGLPNAWLVMYPAGQSSEGGADNE